MPVRELGCVGASTVVTWGHVGLRSCEQMLGPDVMVFVKKLRLLQRKGDEISRDRAVEKTRKYVVSIGEAITAIVRQHPSRALRLEQSLWDVSAPLPYHPPPHLCAPSVVLIWPADTRAALAHLP